MQEHINVKTSEAQANRDEKIARILDKLCRLTPDQLDRFLKLEEATRHQEVARCG